jgi:hypothetical protein
MAEPAMRGIDHPLQDPRSRHGNPAPTTESSLPSGIVPGGLQRPHLQLLALGLAVLVAGGLVVSLLLRSDGRTVPPVAGAGATLVSGAQLERFAESTGHPVYWAGPRDGVSYELTRTSDGRTFVRYLPKDVAAGDPRPDFLVVGTYSRADSFADLKRAANREGAVWVELANNGLMVFASKKPQSVYLGYPGAKYQVEVFAPSSDTARRLVLSGTIVPIR